MMIIYLAARDAYFGFAGGISSSVSILKEVYRNFDRVTTLDDILRYFIMHQYDARSF